MFHSIFFPGKDNWLFDPVTDPVILILPEAFFRNCAIAIVTVLLTVCIMLVVTGGKDPPAGVLRGRVRHPDKTLSTGQDRTKERVGWTSAFCPPNVPFCPVPPLSVPTEGT